MCILCLNYVLAVAGAGGSEERIFGIGPGLAYNQDHHQAKWWVTLNGYFETGAENRPQGIGVILRVSLAS